MFSKEKINTGRQPELDIARGLAVLFMIFIHAQLFFANEAVVDSYFGGFNDFVGMIPSAPMFMFLLGVGINYSKKNEPAIFYKRGMMLLLGGFLLNFIKGFLPSLVNLYRTADITYFYNGIVELLSIDILQFSGLTMLMFGLFKRMKLGNFAIMIIGVLLGTINLFALNIQVENYLLSSFVGLLWGTNHSSYFPFLTWAFYPIAGFLFGSFLIRCNNKKRFYLLTGMIGAFIFFVGGFLLNVWFGLPSGLIADSGYYHHIFSDNIIFSGFIVFEIASLSTLAPIIPNFINKIVARWSKNVTSIFFVHWIIITWATLFVTRNSLDMAEFILLLCVIVVSSDLLTYLYRKLKTPTKAIQESKPKPKHIPILFAMFITVFVCFGSIYLISTTNNTDGINLIEQVENEEIEDYIYTGQVKSETGEPNGLGKAYYNDGSIFEGEFKEGTWHGSGTYIGVDGECYKGDFSQDNYNGYGEYRDSDGSIYKGEFLNGEFNGQGTLTNADGSIESGTWINGVLEVSLNKSDDE